MVGNLRIAYRRIGLCLCVSVFVTACFGAALPRQASAARLADRSLRIESATAGVSTRHTFSFAYVTTGVNVGSVAFEYCTSPLEALPCDAPPGIDASGAVFANQSGEVGFFPLSVQTSRIVLTRAPTQPTTTPSQYVFENVVNPTGAPDTFYARISTYPTPDATGPYTDLGAVVNATTEGVQLSGEVPPYLKFCVGLAIADDCSTAAGNLVDLGDMRTSAAATGTSQVMAATNADFGLAIAMYGTTLTSGNNSIPALANPTVSAPGNAQFGINLRANSSPSVGMDPSGGGIAIPAARYNITNRFSFANGDIIATSPDVTDTRKFTITYLANISPSQPPGVYTATLTYICTATF